ncbi:MAG: hypothetical protein AAGD14_04705 [Planctomycetota bacterium]
MEGREEQVVSRTNRPGPGFAVQLTLVLASLGWLGLTFWRDSIDRAPPPLGVIGRAAYLAAIGFGSAGLLSLLVLLLSRRSTVACATAFCVLVAVQLSFHTRQIWQAHDRTAKQDARLAERLADVEDSIRIAESVEVSNFDEAHAEAGAIASASGETRSDPRLRDVLDVYLHYFERYHEAIDAYNELANRWVPTEWSFVRDGAAVHQRIEAFPRVLEACRAVLGSELRPEETLEGMLASVALPETDPLPAIQTTLTPIPPIVRKRWEITLKWLPLTDGQLQRLAAEEGGWHWSDEEQQIRFKNRDVRSRFHSMRMAREDCASDMRTLDKKYVRLFRIWVDEAKKVTSSPRD